MSHSYHPVILQIVRDQVTEITASRKGKIMLYDLSRKDKTPFMLQISKHCLRHVADRQCL